MSYHSPYTEIHNVLADKKFCSMCHEIKPLDDFYRLNQTTNPNARDNACKPCSRLRRRMYPKHRVSESSR